MNNFCHAIRKMLASVSATFLFLLRHCLWSLAKRKRMLSATESPPRFSADIKPICLN